VKKAKRPLLIICCLLVLFAGWQFYEHRIIELKIHTPCGDDFSLRMPWKERQRLTYFFHQMMIREDGAYTLFGCKPMHMNGYIKPFSMHMAYVKPFSLARDWDIFLMSIRPSNIRISQGWKTWGKYSYLLKNSQFLLWAEENPFWREPHDAVSILLIHRNKLDEKIRIHNDDFKTVLKRTKITSELFLQEAKIKPFLKTILKGHDGLIGTLFGYGRANSWLFEKRKNGGQTSLAPLWDQKLNEYMWNNRNSQDLSLALGYPTFLADPNSQETEQLKAEFLKVREKILDYYKGKDFLEATLGLLLDQPKVSL
jgi:hypothetical protein